MRFTIRDLIWLTLFCATALGWWLDNRQHYRTARDLMELEDSHTDLVFKHAQLSTKHDSLNSYVNAVAFNGMKEYADRRGIGDLEMAAIEHPDSSRWWYRAIAQRVLAGKVPTNTYCEDESKVDPGRAYRD